MPKASAKMVYLVSSTAGVDCNDTADHTLYTVPMGKYFCPDHIVIHTISANMTNYVFSAGKSDAKTDFVATITCSGANATTKMLRIQPNYNAIPAAGSGLMTVMSGGTTFVIDNLTAAGIACTATFDLFGYLY